MLGNDKHRPCIHDEFERIPNSSGRGQRVGNGRLTMRENKGTVVDYYCGLYKFKTNVSHYRLWVGIISRLTFEI